MKEYYQVCVFDPEADTWEVYAEGKRFESESLARLWIKEFYKTTEYIRQHDQLLSVRRYFHLAPKHRGEQGNMRAYNEWRAATHLRRQVIERFGVDSPEAGVARRINDYWWTKWHKSDKSVVAPPADVLKNRLATAAKAMRKHQMLEPEA